MAKKVPEEERIAIAAQVRELLSTEEEIDARPGSFRRVWTQASLGLACGVAQETLRRSIEPTGVTPAVRAGILKISRLSIDELMKRHSGYIEHLARLDPKRRAMIANATKDRAIEILVRQNRSLRQAERAVSAASFYTLGEAGEPSAERWALLGEGLIAADEATKASGADTVGEVNAASRTVDLKPRRKPREPS
jgi:hypothetical protein